MFSKIFIERPKFAFVISIVTVLIGLLSLARLPIAEYPEIAPPTIVVSATYPGASSQVMAETVASIIEEQINGIEDLLYFSSSSDDSGQYQLTLTFESGTNSDIAQVNVQNAIQRAESLLPSDVRSYGVNVSKRSTDIVGFYNFTTTGEKISKLELSNYVRMNVKDPFSRLPGVSSADILGGSTYSMRVWLDPMKLYALNLSPEKVAQAIRSQNIQAAAGSVGSEMSNNYVQLKIDTKGRLKTEEEFKNIVITSTADGRQVILGDIARLELGAESYLTNGFWNGSPSVALGIYRQDGANAIQLIDDANALLADIKTRFPEGVEAFLSYDPTDYIRTSVKEIAFTLISTLVLVVAITFLFLQDWRATLIPALAIPVSLFGTFCAMYALGYSINVLTMFGLILVIGSLVDDAIVVVENTMRIIEEEGLSPKEASLKSMKEITGAIIATTLVTVAVYAPVSFYGGVVGTIYKQFSVTMCIALCISTFNAMTLSPALCSLILRHSDPNRKKNVLFRGFDKVLDFTKLGYLQVSKFCVRRVFFTILILAGVLAANYLVFGKLHSGFLPDEDKGALLCAIELPPGATLNRTNDVMQEFTKKTLEIPGVKDVLTVSGFSFIGGNGENVGLAIAILDDWSLRETPDLSIESIKGKVMAMGKTIPQATVNAFQPPAIMGLGLTGGVSFALATNGDYTPKEFEQQLFKLLGALNDKDIMPSIMYAFSSFNASTPQVFLDINRQKAEALQVPISTIFSTLQSKLAASYVNDFNIYGYSFKVKIQVDSNDRANINNLEQIMVQNTRGEQVPLSAIATLQYTVGPKTIQRFNQSMSASVNGILFPGETSGKAMNDVTKYIQENLPKDYTYYWTDMSYQEKNNDGKIVTLMALAVVFGYLFLVAQYESWTVPLPVMFSVVFATLGGLAALKIYGKSLDIYAQLGLIMLIGLSCKSAILMVEFSMQERAKGLSIEDAALNGANSRYRAVLMTAWSFIIGVFPLMFATGAGSVSRNIIGITTCWGMIIATMIGIAFIPPLYSLCQGVREFVKYGRNKTK